MRMMSGLMVGTPLYLLGRSPASCVGRLKPNACPYQDDESGIIGTEIMWLWENCSAHSSESQAQQEGIGGGIDSQTPKVSEDGKSTHQIIGQGGFRVFHQSRNQ